MTVISATDLPKRYGDVLALDQVDRHPRAAGNPRSTRLDPDGRSRSVRGCHRGVRLPSLSLLPRRSARFRLRRLPRPTGATSDNSGLPLRAVLDGSPGNTTTASLPGHPCGGRPDYCYVTPGPSKRSLLTGRSKPLRGGYGLPVVDADTARHPTGPGDGEDRGRSVGRTPRLPRGRSERVRPSGRLRRHREPATRPPGRPPVRG
jgi:hypothetical protein